MTDLASNPKLPLAVFYVRGNVLHACCMLHEGMLPVVGQAITLPERDLHQRGADVCSFDCPHCKARREKTAQFMVTAVHPMLPSVDEPDGSFLERVLAFRQWHESGCTQHESCRLFDWYSLIGYLGWWDDATAQQLNAELAAVNGDSSVPTASPMPVEGDRISGAVVIDVE